jgi:hypothetical protein
VGWEAVFGSRGRATIGCLDVSSARPRTMLCINHSLLHSRLARPQIPLDDLAISAQAPGARGATVVDESKVPYPLGMCTPKDGDDPRLRRGV